MLGPRHSYRVDSRCARLGRAAARVLLLLPWGMGACDSPQRDDASSATPRGSEPRATELRAAEPAPTRTEVRSLDLLTRVSQCEFRHRGILLDFGSGAELYSRGFSANPYEPTVSVRQGDTVAARIDAQRVRYDFWLDEDVADARIALRLAGYRATRVHVRLDGRALDTWKLPSAIFATLSAVHRGPLGAGRHELELTFSGRSNLTDQGLAAIDWLRISSAATPTEGYAAPTLEHSVTDVGIGNDLRRSVVLRAPASMRCNLLVTPGTQLQLATGLWGTDTGRALIRVHPEEGPEMTLYDERVTGGADARWKPVLLDLSPFAGQLIELQFEAREAAARRERLAGRAEPGATTESAGGRVAFGQPRLVKTLPRVEPGTAHTVVVVVLSEVNQSWLPPWGSPRGLTRLRDLAREGVAFDRYRHSTSLAGPTLATLLTGLHPRRHGWRTTHERLPDSVPMVSHWVKQASGRTAMFTGVPTSFAAFGVARDWDDFEAFSPVQDLPAIEPFTRAAAWLDSNPSESGRRLVVVHARGAHPPWDLSRQQVEALPPPNYSGRLQARRGSFVLQEIRTRRLARLRRLSDQDWVRLDALVHACLEQQDGGLGKIISVLQQHQDWDRTLLLVTSDSTPGLPPAIPFGPSPPLLEERLLAPLLIKFPANLTASNHQQAWTSDLDLAPTILEALGLQRPKGLGGTSLLHFAEQPGTLELRPHVATLGNRYATRWGRWLLTGEPGQLPQLCQTDVDPSCSTNSLDSHARVGRRLWHKTLSFLQRTREPRASELAEIDEPTAAALEVWGN